MFFPFAHQWANEQMSYEPTAKSKDVSGLDSECQASLASASRPLLLLLSFVAVAILIAEARREASKRKLGTCHTRRGLSPDSPRSSFSFVLHLSLQIITFITNIATNTTSSMAARRGKRLRHRFPLRRGVAWSARCHEKLKKNMDEPIGRATTTADWQTDGRTAGKTEARRRRRRRVPRKKRASTRFLYSEQRLTGP